MDVGGCTDVSETEASYYASQEALVAECGGAIRYPTTQQAFVQLYAQRAFLVSGGPGAHLGHDVQYAVGTAISPILCGRIRYYGPAGGYGTLVVAIEHTLNRPVYVTSGDGKRVLIQTFLSIYGHLRATASNGSALTWVAGDWVSAESTIGYVQEDALNGDGGPHLHLGIRLQSREAAMATDGRYWLRGYDSSPTKRSYFADPARFLVELVALQAPILWHPPGTLLTGGFYTDYVVGRDGITMEAIDPLTAEREGYLQRRVRVSRDELSCYREGVYRPRFDHQPGRAPFIGRSQIQPSVSLFYGEPTGVMHRDAFVSWEALLSHGYTVEDVGFFDATEWSTLQRLYPNSGIARMQEGSLVKARGAPAIYVVSQGMRRPIFNWNTFQALGYDIRQVYEIDGATLDAVAGPLGNVLKLDEATLCRSREL